GRLPAARPTTGRLAERRFAPLRRRVAFPGGRAAAHGAAETVDQGAAVAAADHVVRVAGVCGTAGQMSGWRLPPSGAGFTLPGVAFMHEEQTNQSGPTMTDRRRAPRSRRRPRRR